MLCSRYIMVSFHTLGLVGLRDRVQGFKLALSVNFSKMQIVFMSLFLRVWLGSFSTDKIFTIFQAFFEYYYGVMVRKVSILNTFTE